MFAARIAAITAATLLTGVAIAAISSFNPFQAESPKVEEHKMVMQGVGEWEGTITMVMPGMPDPMVMPCTESVTAIGELWTVSRFECDFGGVEFTGSSTFGYDPEKGSFVSTWVDSMNTHITTMNGRYDEKSESIISDYQGKDEATGKMINKRSVCTFEANSYICKFYNLGDEEVLAMTIDMKRKQTVEANAETK